MFHTTQRDARNTLPGGARPVVLLTYFESNRVWRRREKTKTRPVIGYRRSWTRVGWTSQHFRRGYVIVSEKAIFQHIGGRVKFSKIREKGRGTEEAANHWFRPCPEYINRARVIVLRDILVSPKTRRKSSAVACTGPVNVVGDGRQSRKQENLISRGRISLKTSRFFFFPKIARQTLVTFPENYLSRAFCIFRNRPSPIPSFHRNRFWAARCVRPWYRQIPAGRSYTIGNLFNRRHRWFSESIFSSPEHDQYRNVRYPSTRITTNITYITG